MGSRAVVIVCKDEGVAMSRFGVLTPSLGVVYTRTGRRFFGDEALEQQLLTRIQQAAERSGLWDELNTDWLCLDCELMPWSAKAQELLRDQYAPVGTAARHALSAERDVITRAMRHAAGLGDVAAEMDIRLQGVEAYTREYRQYCWPVNSLAELKLAPFHLLATEGAVHTDKPHTWHMETLGHLCADDDLLLKTPFRLVTLDDAESCVGAVRWWAELTSQGNEGMVVKPLDFIATGRRGITQPAIKCRDPNISASSTAPNTCCRPALNACDQDTSAQRGRWLVVSSPSGLRRSSDL